jgi:DNA repair photolyase
VRWDNLTREQDDGGRLPGMSGAPVVRTFHAPEALGINFHEVHAKSAINDVPPMAHVDFRHTINPYRGCSHGCANCFARPTHEYLGFNAKEDFRREIVVKVNLPEVLRAELRRPSWKGEHIALGTNTDPYQWAESKYKITRGVWEELLAVRNPCSILTRSPLLLRDLDLFKELSQRTEFAANLSIPTIDKKVWRETEPGSPNPMKRIEALKELTDAGIKTGVLVAPLMPGINDSPKEIERILELCGEAGASSIGGIGLHLRGKLKSVWMDWLREYRPDLVERYEKLYAQGSHLPKAERARLQRMIKRGRMRTPGAAPANASGAAAEGPGRRVTGSGPETNTDAEPTARGRVPIATPQTLF